ncbi:transmembrane emp24 domain-containing protein p24delta9 [Ziziphus jujuba]|nr:transmembrane emp24 domain-containing protein p24delta9 [Ziziphus jujuba]
MVESRLAVFLLVVGFLSFTSESLRFDLKSGLTKCISEDINSNSMTVGKYSIVNPNEGHPLPDSHKLTVRVTSQYGNTLHSADHQDSGQFSFAAAEAGSYMTCFFAPDHKPETTLTVDFDWRTGVSTKDWSNVAKKGSVELMELELKKMLDTVTTIHEEMFYLRLKEEEMQELNKSTSTKMTVFTLLSIVICLSVAGMQLWHLKTFFEKKKLI